MYEVFAFVFGICWGSFLNVAVNRPRNKKKNERSLMGRSFCDSCKRTLVPLDLVPVLSYIALKGKCRYCKSSIPFKNLLVELMTGVFSALAWMAFSNSSDSLVLIGILMLVFFLFVYLSAYDLWWQEIPIVASALAVILSVIYRIGVVYESREFELSTLLFMILPLAVIFFINLLYRQQAFGAGDYFVLAIIGLTCVPIQIFISMEVAVLSAALVGILVSIRIGKLKGVRVALVPFVNFGWLVALNFGDFLWDLLFHLE
jgi:prepilin signal peptidase PulO-like enzyme (type II secretory pathway)